MANIGRKIYYGKSNGIILWDKGEMSGSVVETTLEQDKEIFPILTLITSEELGVKQLNYGELRKKIEKSKGYRINPQTKEIEFVFNE